MADEPLRWNLALNLGEDASAEELDESARLLRRELEEAGVGEASLAQGGAAPAGTKAPEALLAGVLSLTMLPAAVQGLAMVLADWAGRRPGRALTLEYGTGERRLVVQYDPRQTDVQQLVAALMQAQTAEAARIAVGGDMVTGDKVTNTQAGGDVVGRDKVTHIQVAAGATMILNDRTPPASVPGPAPLPAD
jgi:hypothetical protein